MSLSTPRLPLPLPVVHMLFEASGYVLAAVIFALRRRTNGDVIDGRTRYAVMIGAGLGAMIGARLLAALCDPIQLFAGLRAGQLVLGKTVVGSLLGGLVGVELTKLRLGEKAATGDPLALPFAVGMAVGRIGCFLAASIDDTAGLPATVPWAVRGLDGIARHPVALYEIAFLMLLAPFAHYAGRRGIQGDVFKLFLAGYLLFRFVCDFLKPLPPRIYGGFSAIQLACLGGLAWYALIAWHRVRAEAPG